MKVENARRAVAIAGDLWRLRLSAWAGRPTANSRKKAVAAAEKLDDAIGTMLEAVYVAETSRRKK